jgi:hypothetical protein
VRTVEKINGTTRASGDPTKIDVPVRPTCMVTPRRAGGRPHGRPYGGAEITASAS